MSEKEITFFGNVECWLKRMPLRLLLIGMRETAVVSAGFTTDTNSKPPPKREYSDDDPDDYGDDGFDGLG